jgi:transmembrane sensor
MAAAFAAVIGGWAVLNQINAQEIITQPGQHRTVDLADGSSVKMNGGTTIRFDKRYPREVELATGEALFDVHHDASDPFVVMAGTTRLVDAGTIFNVVSENGMIDVAVAHGAVIYEPGRADIRLDAGQALYRSAQNTAPVMRKAVIETVGSWRQGTLQFDNASLEMVARDLERNTGLEVRADPAIRQQRFSGTLTVGGAVDQVFARVGPLLGVRFVPDGPAWKMIPANGSRR